MVLGIAVFFTFSLKMTDSPLFRAGSRIKVYVNDATGIFVNSKVKLSGIDVGVVDRIELEGLRARITLVIDKGVKLPDPAVVVPKPLGVLGDKYLEIQRATEEDLKEAEKNQPQGFRWITDWLLPAAHAAFIDGPSREYKTGEVLPARNQAAALDDLMRDVAKLSTDMKIITNEVRDLVTGNRSKINTTLSNFEKLTTDLAELTSKMNDPEIKAELEKLSQTVVQMGNTVRNLELISQKVANGEGTLGKLVNDTETVDRMNEALGAVNATIDRARRVQTWVDLESQYLGQTGEVQTRVNLGLFTSYDFAYWAGIAIDDYGTFEKTVTTTTVGGGVPQTTTETIRKPNAVKFSFLLYKKFSHVAAAAGMLENSGGFQLELFNRRESLRLTSAVYDLGSDTNPLVRVGVTYQPWSVFTISAGYFHLLEKSNLEDARRSWSVGVGLRFTDDDLKTVLLIPGVG